MKLQRLFLLLILVGTTFSCGKKDPQPASRTELLVAKKWQVRSAVYQEAGFPDQDVYALSPACSRDDYEQFNTPNTFVYDEGATKCSASSPQTRVGVWALFNNDTQLAITDDGFRTTYTIDELTDKSLKISSSQPQTNGTTAILRATYVSIN
jgi:hypothetical protein